MWRVGGPQLSQRTAIAAGDLINIFLIEDIFRPPASYSLLMTLIMFMTKLICSSLTQKYQPTPPSHSLLPLPPTPPPPPFLTAVLT